MILRALILITLIGFSPTVGADDADLRILGQTSICGGGPCQRVVQLSFYRALGDTLIFDWHRLAGYAEQYPTLERVSINHYNRLLAPRKGLQLPNIDFSPLAPESAILAYIERPDRNWSADPFTAAAEKWWIEQVQPILDEKPRTLLDLNIIGLDNAIIQRFVQLGADITPALVQKIISQITHELEIKILSLAEAWRLNNPGQRAWLAGLNGREFLLHFPGGDRKHTIEIGQGTVYHLARAQQKAVFGGLVDLPLLRDHLAPVASRAEVTGFLDQAGLDSAARRPLVLVNLNAGTFKLESAEFTARMRVEIVNTVLKANPAPDVALILPTPLSEAEQKDLAKRLSAWNRRGPRVALVPGNQVALIDGLVERADLVLSRDTSLGHLAHARLGREGMNKFVIFGMDRDHNSLDDIDAWRPPGAKVIPNPVLEEDQILFTPMFLRTLEQNLTSLLTAQGFPPLPSIRQRVTNSLSGALDWCRNALLGQ